MKLRETLSKHPNILLGIALLMSSVAISIRSVDGEIKFVFHQYPAIIFSMIVFSSFLVAFYFYIINRKVLSLSDEIKEHSHPENDGFDVLLNELTERQKEVYDLILSGKTNKEIMSELFIEQSTLKTHINQIYGKLNIKSRRELRSKIKS